jgi:HAMP domain-containing protein
MRARLTGMTVGLAVGITAAVSIASAVGAYLFSLRHSETLLNTARASALAQAELIRGGLEHGMMEDSRTLIERMIRAYGREPGVLNVMLLDRDGVVQFSSGQHGTGDELSLESPTCQACHQYPAAERASSRVLEARGGAILRTVVPFHNHVECQQCHDPGHAINGVLISDLDATEIRAAASRDVRWMVTVSGVTTLLLLTAIGVVVRLVVLRRLQSFETVARQISQGDLSRRVSVSGSDTIAWLGREFNAMADAMGGLVGQVRSERERLEDLLAEHFMRHLGERFGVERRISPAALAILRRHDWPGNVRELRHVIEAAMIVCEGPEVRPEHLPTHLLHAPREVPSAAGGQPLQTLEQLERAHIEQALEATQGRRSHAARILGISERNLYRKLHTYGLLP